MRPDRELVLPEIEGDGDWVGLGWSQPAAAVVPVLSEPSYSVNLSVRCGANLDVPSSREIGGQSRRNPDRDQQSRRQQQISQHHFPLRGQRYRGARVNKV